MDMPFEGTPAGEQKDPVRLELKDTGFLRTEQGRDTLKYLVSCAMPDSVELYGVYDDIEYKFRGSMNLAPGWLDEKLTDSEQRWVSACIFARTNYFRKKVMISMRTKTEPAPEFLKASPAEEAAATIYEGDFFGNIFSHEPVAYTCLGSRTEEQNKDDILKVRICTEVDNTIAGMPLPMTYCHFLVTGYCDESGSHTVKGVTYNEYLSVYLRPLGQRKKE